MTQFPVTLYSFSFVHHGQFSSFHRLLHYVPGVRVMDITFPLNRNLGPVWRRRLEFRWQRWSEWRLRPVFVRRERQCVHYLYPENSLFRGATWKNGHGLVLSCHQPGLTLRQLAAQPLSKGFFQGLATADRIVLLAQRFRKDYEEFCDPRRITVIPHGVDVDFFRPADKPIVRPKILTIGNWLRDYEFWTEVALRLAVELPGAEFTVLAFPEIIDQARARVEGRLAGRVKFLHRLTDEQLRDLYHEAAVLFLPLKDAGANNALLEAMAVGLPMVLTDLPATREYAADCALYYKPGATEECITTLKDLLSNGRKRIELSQASRQRAVEHFAWEVIAARYARLYAEVLQEQ